jgi:hypothetical protein
MSESMQIDLSPPPSPPIIQQKSNSNQENGNMALQKRFKDPK